MLKQFAPELSGQMIFKMYVLRLRLWQGKQQILESISLKRYPEILDYARPKLVRPGLLELLDFLDTQGIPFVVVLGGLCDMVETLLDQMMESVILNPVLLYYLS